MFDISIEQKVLMKALEYLEPTVGKNSNQLGDNCISMRTTGNGSSLELYTTNTLEFTKVEAIIAVGGNTVEQAPYVDFKRFKAIIGSIPENEIVSLKASVNDLLINFALKPVPIQLIGCNNGMIPLPANQFASSDAVAIPKYLVTQILGNVCSIITDSTSAPIYNCVRLYTNGNTIEASALDMTGKRTFTQSGYANNNNPQKEILVEASKLKKSIKIYEDFDEIEFNMDASMIRADGITPLPYGKSKGMISNVSYFARRINGAFPQNISAMYSPAPTEFAEINIEEIKNSLTRIKAIEDSSSSGQIGFEVSGNSCIISMNSAYGNIEDNITTENKLTKSFKTALKYDNLFDIINVINNASTFTLEIGVLPNHPNNYVVKSKGSTDIMFTIPSMVNAGGPGQP